MSEITHNQVRQLEAELAESEQELVAAVANSGLLDPEAPPTPVPAALRPTPKPSAPARLLTFQEMTAGPSLFKVFIPQPEGCEQVYVYVREMSASEMLKLINTRRGLAGNLMRAFGEGQAPLTEDQMAATHIELIRIVCSSICNEHGEMLFTNASDELLRKIPYAVFAAVSEAHNNLKLKGGLGKASDEENPSTANPESSSDSPTA